MCIQYYVFYSFCTSVMMFVSHDNPLVVFTIQKQLSRQHMNYIFLFYSGVCLDVYSRTLEIRFTIVLPFSDLFGHTTDVVSLNSVRHTSHSIIELENNSDSYTTRCSICMNFRTYVSQQSGLEVCRFCMFIFLFSRCLQFIETIQMFVPRTFIAN